MDSTDILVAGGGIAGLVAAAILSSAGRSVTLVDPAPPTASAAAEGSDLRSTAFLHPARALLDRAGLWERLAPSAVPLDTLRLVETAGWPPEERLRRDFTPDELGLQSFGWNLPNWLTRRELTAALNGRVDLRLGVGFRDMLVRDREVRVTLTDGARLSAQLVVAADGHASPVRAAAGIGVRTTRYGQKALAFAVTHPEPHDDVSTEIYNRGGAFTLVPLPDRDGSPASAVVWMDDGPRALALAAMDDDAFGHEATQRSAGVLGPLAPVSPRRVWPVVTQVAERIAAPRVALVAEAAHVLPPIGAQGLNTSLQDVDALARALSGASDPGGESVLARYDAARRGDIHARARAIDLFNRVCRSGEAPLAALRRTGLVAAHDLPALRRGLMRAGLGTSDPAAGRGSAR